MGGVKILKLPKKCWVEKICYFGQKITIFEGKSGKIREKHRVFSENFGLSVTGPIFVVGGVDLQPAELIALSYGFGRIYCGYFCTV